MVIYHSRPALSIVGLACLLAIAILLGSVRVALAEAPLIFKIPHEVQWSAMLVIDLDGDGKKEIITGSIDGYLTVVDGATYRVLWDKNLGDYLRPNFDHTRMQSSLAAADLDNDGRLDLVIATGGVDPINLDGPGVLLVLSYVGGSEPFQRKEGWPFWATDQLGPINGKPDGYPDGFYSTPSLGDIDGDGDKEIVIGGTDRRLYAFHDNGTFVTGWPLARDYRVYRESRSTAALADLDGDGILDILMGSNNYAKDGCPNPYVFYGIKGGETLTLPVPLPGFPFSTVTQNIESSPAVGDINGDGSPDVVFGTGDFDEHCGGQPDGKKVYALDHLGNLLPGWPVTTGSDTVNSPALGDLDNDGQPEVVINTWSWLYAWHGDGTPVQGFPVYLNQGFSPRHSSPVLADVDGDSQVEILLPSGQVYGPSGQIEQQREKLQSKLVVTDQDGDGLLETIGANNFIHDNDMYLKVFVYQETGSAAGVQPWPTFHRSDDRTGVLPPLFPLSGSIVDESNKGVAGVEVKLQSGQSTLTNEHGDYRFINLPPDNYIVTPSYQGKVFKPSQRTLVVSSMTTVDDFVLGDALYDIQGQVLQANNAPLAGVKVQLKPGSTAVTNANGSFSFAKQQPGKYTLKPLSPALHYLPAQRTVIAQDEIPQLFYALPLSVTIGLSSTSTTEIVFTDTQGLLTRITLPAGNADEEATVTPMLAAAPNGYMSAGHAFEIEFSGSMASAQSQVSGQDDESLTIGFEIQYSQADLQKQMQDEELVLLWKSPAGWIDSQATCPAASAVDNDLALSKITGNVCEWGTYGLFAPVGRLFIPIILGQAQ